MKGKSKPGNSLEELGRIAGGLAHEIKNPLSTIGVNLALLREDWAEAKTPSEKRSLKKIELLQREVKRLESILNDFLRYAKGQELHLQLADVHEAIQEVVDFIEPEAKTKKVQIRSSFSYGLPKVLLDRVAFQQALLNIVVNARDAMPDGGELILRTERAKNFILIEVTDTGVGMPPENLEKCFDVYYSTKRGGTGLGLPTVKRIIEKHGGSVSVRSELGKGTQFSLLLPLPREKTE